MKRNIFETIIGAIVLCVALGFIVIAYQSGKVSSSDGYQLFAKFDQADGLNVGSDARVSGLKVGSVTKLVIDPKTYLAIATITVENDVKLPKDTTAKIVSDGLLGGKYLSLVPGGDPEMLKQNEQIQFTQSSINLEQLIGKFAFGGVDDKKPDGEQGGKSGSDAPSQF